MNESEVQKLFKTSELMKSLTYDFSTDIIELVLPSASLKGKNIDFFEPIILGIFLMGRAYYLAKSNKLSKEAKGKQLENFHQEIHNSLINDICIGIYKINDTEDIHAFSDSYAFTLDQRFMEYFPLVNPDITSDNVNLSKSFAKHFFKEKVNQYESDSFVSHLNIAIALHFARMVERIKDLSVT
jgi:hypothetical protein